MTNEEAIKAIKDNYPPSRYTMLREALNMAIETLEKVPEIWEDGTLEVTVESLEALDKINRVLVKVKDDVWANLFDLAYEDEE